MENCDHCITPINRRPLSQEVYEKLKISILNQEIEAGTKLSEIQVAKMVGTSPTPVREAFRLLAAEGLVRIEPWKGVVVQSFSEEEIRDVFQCREALELLALELTIKNLRNSDRLEDELKNIDREFQKAENAEFPDSFVNVTSGIHNYWIRGSKNQRLIVLMDSLNDVLIHDRNISAMDNSRRCEIIGEHREILKAIQRLDSEAAKKALQRHILNGCEYSLKIRSSKNRIK